MPYFKFVSAILVLLIVDLATKFLFYNMGIWSQVLPPTFNTGISFGIEVNTLFVRWITILFLIIISYFSFKKRIHPLVGIFLIAGTLGNFIDRVRLHGVRDFIWLGFGAVFNVADIYITVWAGLALLKEFKNSKNSITVPKLES